MRNTDADFESAMRYAQAYADELVKAQQSAETDEDKEPTK